MRHSSKLLILALPTTLALLDPSIPSFLSSPLSVRTLIDIPDIPDFSFQECLPATDIVSPNCGFMQLTKAITTLATFTSCTGWNAADLAVAMLDSFSLFGEVITECKGFQPPDPDNLPPPDAVPPDAGACLEAIKKISTGDSPLSSYILDLYGNPKKYCACNKNFGSDLPLCTIPASMNPSGISMDTQKIKSGSCLFKSLCTEFEGTCDLILKGISDCINTADIAVGNGASTDGCNFECSSILIPTPCMQQVTPTFTEVLHAYKEKCKDTTPDGEGGGGGSDPVIVPPTFDDFNNCLDYSNLNPASLPTCVPDIALGSSIVSFMTCTQDDWNVADVVKDFTGGDIAFEEIIGYCQNFSPDGMDDCFSTLYDMSEDKKNPLSKYAEALYENSDVYCGCNNRLYKGLPDPCIFTLPTSSKKVNMGEVKFGSCLIGELCFEIAESCKELSSRLDSCLPTNINKISKDTCSNINAGCQDKGVSRDMMSKNGFPPTCTKSFTKAIKTRADEYVNVCIGGGAASGGGADDSLDDDGTKDDTTTTKSAAFPPGAALGLGLVAATGFGYFLFKKVLKKRQHPNMTHFSMDDNFSMEGGESGIGMGEVHNVMQLRAGGARLKGEGLFRAASGNDEDDENEQLTGDGEGGGRKSRASKGSGFLKKPSNVVNATVVNDFQIGDYEEEGGGGMQLAKKSDSEVVL